MLVPPRLWPALRRRNAGQSASREGRRSGHALPNRLIADAQHVAPVGGDVEVGARCLDKANGTLDDRARMLGIAAGVGKAERRQLPRILMVDLGGTDLELVAQPRQHRAYDLALVLE